MSFKKAYQNWGPQTWEKTVGEFEQKINPVEIQRVNPSHWNWTKKWLNINFRLLSNVKCAEKSYKKG